LAESYKLDPWPLDRGSKTKKKWQIEANLHGTTGEGKAIGSDPLNKTKIFNFFLKKFLKNFKKKKRFMIWKPRCKLESNSRMQFALNK
jgi:hypothetical protein